MVFSTRTLHREGDTPLIEIQAGPAVEDEALPLELQQAMLSTVLSRVGPGLKVPDLEDLVLRGVLGPSAVNDIEGRLADFEPAEEPAPRVETAVSAPAPAPAALTAAEQLVAAGIPVQVAELVARTGAGADPKRALASYLRQLPVRYPDEYETAIVVIDGPHGGGRTTALLRMALDCSEAGRLAIVAATENRDPAEVDRLVAYAEAMGVGFVELTNDRALEKTIRKAERGSVIFVDAGPGWLPPAFVRAPVYRYVALPAHWQDNALATWSAATRHEPFAGAIPTFTDIATELTPVVSTLVALGTGIAFLSSGSDISSGIEVADAKAIASGILSMPTGGRTDGRLVASA